jgi:dipeptidyl-peptidase-4
VLAVSAAWLLQAAPGAQDRLASMPGYAQFQKMAAAAQGAVVSGAVQGVAWKDGTTFEFVRGGRRYRYDVNAKTATDVGAVAQPQGGRGGRGGGPARGRQLATVASPDAKLRAEYRGDKEENDRAGDPNIYLVDVASGAETRITSDGNHADRTKNGSGSWVYGEELDQNTAMWWSPDSKKLAYYRFDEKPVPDYYLQMDQTKLQSRLDREAYPKAGRPNPIVELFVYDLDAKKATRIDVRDGKPFDNTTVGHYVYKIAWSPDGRELLFNRTNRRQNVLEFVAANPETGATRVIIREEWPTGWVENSPPMQLLEDGRRFIWQSERNGWSNLYLYDLSGKLIAPLTTHATFEVGGLIKVDEAANAIFYTARDGDNHLKMQLHRVGLDGKGDVRLTDPAFHHTFGSCMQAGGRGASGPGGPGLGCPISPDNRFFVDRAETHDTPPATRVVDASTAKVVAEVAQSDISKFTALGLKKVEMFTYKAADGKTTLRGLIHFPSTFDPSKKYPALVSVYGGPGSPSSTARETFVTPDARTEYGFLVLNLDSRAAPGMGKRTLDAIYMKLGVVEMDDMAEGVKSLWSRPYFDRTRVGMFGTSYGGYSSALSLLRHPDVYAAASASSPVTAWYHYDSIYTERYMWIPEENKDGYEAGNAMNYAKNLKGRLMLYYGTADNNVHPSNTMQLIAALQAANKSFDVQVGPDRGHTGINGDRMMEFFIENLIMKASATAATTASK